ncbi:MAG: class I SAM-dependent DNA methyltransferase [Gemmatimonadota bacterium]|nr:class I SAM-dependent DNA methyltransferase [Gemmatimonadota bacterium]
MPTSFQELSNFIWAVADLLRGPYRPPQYERVMLPMTVLRRFDCVLEPTKEAVLRKYASMQDGIVRNIDSILNRIAGNGEDIGFHNHSQFDFQRLKGDPDNIAHHLGDYIAGFSENVRELFSHFNFEAEIEKLEEANRLYQVVSKFADIDLSPERADNITMGLLFEDLIRRFNEAANETAGDHFTPREVIRLMTNLLLEPDSHILTSAGVIVKICDPACGTGGMLSEAQNWIRSHNEDAIVIAYGQDYNPRSYAVSASDLLIKGHRNSRIALGDTLTNDHFHGEYFDYLLANPPFGVDWKGQQAKVVAEHKTRGYGGRFGPKLPRVNDGALLFLLHMIAKFEQVLPEQKKNGARCAIVFNGSPLFTGGAGSGESEIRRWIIENDWLEAIVALPEQMFYNTGIGTFVWVVTNRKVKARKGRIQLIDARESWKPMRRSLGDKRRYLDNDTIAAITREHGAFEPSETCKIFENSYFGYRRITVERPLRLRFQITDDAKEQFLDACPEFLDMVRDLERTLGIDAYDDWNEAWAVAQRLAKEAELRWTAASRKHFRNSFTEIDPEAKPVISKRINANGLIDPELFPGQTLIDSMNPTKFNALFGLYADEPDKKGRVVEYEADPALRDFENVPLKEDIVSYFMREVQPFVEDAWINRSQVDEKDGGIGKVGYEINFNRVFFKYKPPRPLEEIDAELAAVENRILKRLSKVTA